MSGTETWYPVRMTDTHVPTTREREVSERIAQLPADTGRSEYRATRWHYSRDDALDAAGMAPGSPEIDLDSTVDAVATYADVSGAPTNWSPSAPDTNPVTLARHAERRQRSASGRTAREVTRRGRHTVTVGSTIAADGVWDASDLCDEHGRLTEGRLAMATDAFLRAAAMREASEAGAVGDELAKTARVLNRPWRSVDKSQGVIVPEIISSDRSDDAHHACAVRHDHALDSRVGLAHTADGLTYVDGARPTTHAVRLDWEPSAARTAYNVDMPDDIAAMAPRVIDGTATVSSQRERPAVTRDHAQVVTCAAGRWFVGHHYVREETGRDAPEAVRAQRQVAREREIHAAAVARQRAAEIRDDERASAAEIIAAMAVGESRVIGTTRVTRIKPPRGRSVWQIGARTFTRAARAATAIN